MSTNRNSFKDAYRNFMRGRNGADSLSFMLSVLALVLAAIGMIARSTVFQALAVAAVVAAVARMLSKDTAKRAQESREYLDLVNRADKRIKLAKLRVKNRKTTAYFPCKTCGTILAVPKGKGKVRVKCPKCHTSEIHES